MSKFALTFILAFSLSAFAQTGRKKSKPTQDSPTTSEDTCSPAYGGCSDDYSSDSDQSSDSTVHDRSETYEGNDRDSGSDSVDSVAY